METRFDVAEWQPSKPLEPGDAVLSGAYISNLASTLNHQTEEILHHPYDPNTWLWRSVTLSRLRYPELAVGDAYKAKLLCQAHLSRLYGRNGWSLGHRMEFWMYNDPVHDDERTELLRENLKRIQDRANHAVEECTELFQDDPEGHFRRIAYPWMSERHRRRSYELIKAINEEFGTFTANYQTGASCLLRRHAFGEGIGASDTSELLGIFAARDIQKGEVVLIDETRTWGCNGPGVNGDYMNLHSGRGCFDPLHPSSESDETWSDLRWIRDKSGKSASSIIRNCKLLLCSVQDNVKHPLDHPLIARMTPNYPKDKISKFSLRDDIEVPNAALQQFGVDIFANHNYDTWVMFTIEARARNNSCGDPVVDLLNPLFCLFNHSCSPNMEWKTSEDHQSITVEAGTDICEGQQLFVLYDGFIQDEPLHKRRKTMWRWLDGPCQCERCVLEEKALRLEKDVATLGQKADRLDLPLPKSENSDWDTEDKPVFPEDLLKLKN